MIKLKFKVKGMQFECFGAPAEIGEIIRKLLKEKHEVKEIYVSSTNQNSKGSSPENFPGKIIHAYT
ncbi:hypothetical protein [Candidatus Hecatella orcuttiae]|jgi:hypothetical protein|uniref:hypothetical protein n=1 Tax=Candidatus Hecatella orcuttiae TaxID=1935119 RepID=UPI00286820E9|nr:hypothetical protein [Candidatus Hecatella orcuttiae]